jgi:hypothetical protein
VGAATVGGLWGLFQTPPPPPPTWGLHLAFSIHFVAILHMSLQISCVKVRFHPFIIIYATDIGSLAVFKDHFCCKK